jgi:hypothetical protein
MYPYYSDHGDLHLDDILAICTKYRQCDNFTYDSEEYRWVCADTTYNITANFSSSEFISSCSQIDGNFIISDGVMVLQMLRERYGAIKITSTFRNESCNADVDGTIQSEHQLARAIDFVILSKSKFALLVHDIKNKGCDYYLLKAFGVRGIGLYDRHLHIDFRNSKRMVIWEGKSKFFTQ